MKEQDSLIKSREIKLNALTIEVNKTKQEIDQIKSEIQSLKDEETRLENLKSDKGMEKLQKEGRIAKYIEDIQTEKSKNNGFELNTAQIE